VSKNGETVAAFEREFAAYVGAKYAIALCNGTATLHTALAALGVNPGDRVAVPPLTMSSTTIAVLHAGAVPVFCDVLPRTWLAAWTILREPFAVTVSLYGLQVPTMGGPIVDDAAQTLRKHSGAAFTSYSFQASKILSCGEGGALATNDEALAAKARSFSSLGYQLDPTSPRIDSHKIRSPDYARHHALGWNYRMSDHQAAALLRELARADDLLRMRRAAAGLYADAIAGCAWLTPQHVPEGWGHDYWAYSVALTWPPLGLTFPPAFWEEVASAIQRHGGERPYAAWRLTYQEPAFRHLAPDGPCSVAESLQPRLLQFQTNHIESAEKNAEALRFAIKEIGG
jgi:perosamine synthetase